MKSIKEEDDFEEITKNLDEIDKNTLREILKINSVK
jgi:tetrahydromethanopterin S-methyltransferase subunit G